MADGEKRIVELQEVQSFGTGDYLALDNIENATTKKILAKKLGITYTIELTEDGFIFSGDNGYSQEIIIPKDEQMSYEDYQDLSEEEKMNNANRFIPDYPNSEATPEIWARVGTDPLNTKQKTISKAINELDARDKNSISDEYDPVAGTYAVGDTCLESNLLRVCNTAIDTPHAFDETEWDTKTLGEYCAELKSNLTDLETYSTDEIVIGDFLGKPLYRKVYNLGSDLLVNAQTWTNTNISNSNIFFIERVTCYTSGGTCMGFFCANRDTQSYVQLLQTRTTAVNVRYIVLEYTKVTD